MDYYKKYLKYKSKYLELLNQNNQVGGGNKLVIHISGPSGAGKTTLGNKLKEKFGNKIVVKDIDDLRAEYVEKKYGSYQKLWKIKNFVWDKESYQQWIDDYVDKQTKPLVFVGLNHMPWWNKKLYYNMHSSYNFYIKLDSDIIFKQKCNRFINDVFIKNKEAVLNDIIKNEKNTIDDISNGLKHECGYNEIVKMNNTWNKDYKKQGYKFMTREQILKKVSVILTKYHKKMETE